MDASKLPDDLRYLATFRGSDALDDVPDDVSEAELRIRLQATDEPAPLILEVFDAVRARVPTARTDAFGLIAATGRLEVRHEGARAHVLLTWAPPPERRWIVSVTPVRVRRRSRSERDLALVRELLPLCDEVLRARSDVSDLRWLTADEAAREGGGG